MDGVQLLIFRSSKNIFNNFENFFDFFSRKLSKSWKISDFSIENHIWKTKNLKKSKFQKFWNFLIFNMIFKIFLKILKFRFFYKTENSHNRGVTWTSCSSCACICACAWTSSPWWCVRRRSCAGSWYAAPGGGIFPGFQHPVHKIFEKQGLWSFQVIFSLENTIGNSHET